MSITPLTRATFIAANHVQIALSQKTMYKLVEGEGGKEVHIPESFKMSGIPQGYSAGAFPSCLYQNHDYLIVCRDRFRFRSSNGGGLPCQVWHYHCSRNLKTSSMHLPIWISYQHRYMNRQAEFYPIAPEHSFVSSQKRATEDASLAEDDAKEK